MVLRAYRYRFYPTVIQLTPLAKTFGACRFVYNYFLNEKQKHYKEHGKTLSYGDCSKRLSELKEINVWLKEVSSVPLQQSLRHLETGFQKFYKRQAKFPKYKKKFYDQSATFMRNALQYKDGQIFLAKFGEPLAIRWSRRFTGEPSSITISRDRRGRYYVSILIEEIIKPLPLNQNTIGIDLGLTHAFTTSDEKKEEPLRCLQTQLTRLKRGQRSFSRKKKGSANQHKARRALRALSGKIRDRRHDYLHKKTTTLVSENQVICVESLSVKNMMKNKRLARNIGDAGWGTFLQFLEYKCSWYGRTYKAIDQFFPSSKRCFCCQTDYDGLTLKDRMWICPECNTLHDRDINAAKNIEEEGLRQIGWSTVGHTGFKACGADVRPMWQTTGSLL